MPNYDPRSNTAQLIARFNSQLSQAQSTFANLRSQLAGLAATQAQLVNAVGYTNQKSAGLKDENARRIAIPPTFTPRMGGDPDMMRMPLEVARPGSSPFSGYEGITEDDLADNGGEQPIFDEEND